MSSNEKKTHVKTQRPEGDYLRIIPLGGLDEVGMNCCIFECNGSMIMLDCGLTFPELEGFGIDIILPDWAYVLDNLDMLDAVVVTHGHEDHLGALPFFLKEVDVPVYSGRFTLALLEKKLDEHNLSGMVDLITVEPGESLKIGSVDVEFIHVNHSVPNAMSLAINTPLGRVLFTGDWKLDQTPFNEDVLDLQRFAQLGQEGVLALLGDSTNAQVDGFTRSESVVLDSLSNIIEHAPGRVFIGMFSSNINRVAGLVQCAHKIGRKVCFMGRSLRRNVAIARELGFLDIPDANMVVEAEKIGKLPDNKLLVLTTGSQGEPRSGMVRMARGEHRHLNITQGDTVIFSARRIPGNDRQIFNLFNTMTLRGADVIDTSYELPVHGSGHAKRGEMQLLINLTKPKYLIPVHGEYRMRAAHAAIGKQLGVDDALIIQNGDVLEVLPNSKPNVIDRVHVGRILVDGSRTDDIDDVQLRDRRKLAYAGMIVAFAVVDMDNGNVVSGPDLMERGFLKNDADPGLLNEAADYTKAAVLELSREARRDVSEVKEAIRLAVRRFFRKKLDRKPVVVPVVHEL